MGATGLAKGGLYGHFENKDAIAAAAFEHSLNKVRADLLNAINRHSTSIEKLYAILSFYRNYTLKPSVEGGCPIMNTAVDADDAYPFLKKKAKAALNEMLTGLQGIIEKGIVAKELRPGIHARKTAEMIFAQIEGGIMIAKVSDDATVLNSVLDHLKHYLETEVAR